MRAILRLALVALLVTAAGPQVAVVGLRSDPGSGSLPGSSSLPGAGSLPDAGPGTGPDVGPPGIPVPVSEFGWPLRPVPVVSRPFQPPSRPYGPGHRGADLVGTEGQDVLAAGAGVVVYAAPLADRGVVSVDHAGGLRTTYEPVAARVRAGQIVARGEVLGTLAAGHAGCPAPACLHWGLRRDRVYLDPLLLVRPAHVRLLPWAAEP